MNPNIRHMRRTTHRRPTPHATHTSALMSAPMTHIDPQYRAHKHLPPPPCLTTRTCPCSHCPYEEDSSLRHLTTAPRPHQSAPYQPTPMPQSPYTPPTQTHIPPYPTRTHTISYGFFPNNGYSAPNRTGTSTRLPTPSCLRPPPTPMMYIYIPTRL